MAISKLFNGKIELSKTLAALPIGGFVVLEVADGYTVDQAMRTVTGCSVVRKKTGRSDRVAVELSRITGIRSDHFIVRMIKIERKTP